MDFGNFCRAGETLSSLVPSFYLTNLFLGDRHVVSDVREDGRLDEISCVAVSVATTLQFGALLLTNFDQAQNLLELLCVDLHEKKWMMMMTRLNTFYS